MVFLECGFWCYSAWLSFSYILLRDCSFMMNSPLDKTHPYSPPKGTDIEGDNYRTLPVVASSNSKNINCLIPNLSVKITTMRSGSSNSEYIKCLGRLGQPQGKTPSTGAFQKVLLFVILKIHQLVETKDLRMGGIL